MNGNIALALPTVILPLPVVGELLFGAENSGRSLKNLNLYLQFIDACSVIPMDKETAIIYSRTRLALKRKGRPIPENDIWIAAQFLSNNWTLVTDDRDFDYVEDLQIERW
jgi:tRNA(fMet)-specific endonuclease VapC